LNNADNKKTALNILTGLLIVKFGQEKIEKLLTGEMTVELNKDFSNRKSYIRDFKHNKTPFTDYDGQELDADLVLIALDDAANEMSYSNWHTDKFDRAAEAVIRYCEEHDILIKFRERDE
jgi:hypothetical protein